MYQKYHTEALVLGSREIGESDKMLVLYTADFGLVRARASALRSEHSKMRCALQNYSRVRISLVKGRRGWRAAGASVIAPLRGDAPGTAVFARAALLVMRLVHGEEKSTYLFEALAQAHEALAQAPMAAIGSIEIVCIARVLYSLGYLSAEAVGSALFSHTFYRDDALAEAAAQEGILLGAINRAIAEANL